MAESVGEDGSNGGSTEGFDVKSWAQTLAQKGAMDPHAGGAPGGLRHATAAEAGPQLGDLHHRAHEIRSQRLAKALGSDNRGDWSSKYAAFDDWVAEEEYAEKAAADERARVEKEEAAKRRALAGGCNHDHSAERELWEMPTQKKLESCVKFRAEGNAWFEEGQFARAAERYRKVTVWLDYTFPDTDEMQLEVNRVHLPALVNHCVCCLKMGDYGGVLEHSRHALQIDSNNVKALYCRARALRHTAELEAAGEVLKKALILEPESYELLKEAAILKSVYLAYKVESLKAAKAMFEGGRGDDSATQSRKVASPNTAIDQKENQSSEHPLLLAAPKELDEIVNMPQDQDEELLSDDDNDEEDD